jgi:protein-tyrosine phosphatase
VIHCTAGKDRTGFTVAVLLSALGVDRDDIYADYLLGSRRDPLQADSPSSQFLTRLLGRELVPDEARFMHGVRREYLDASMEAIARDWGSMQDYLHRGLSLDDARLGQLRRQFLE